MQTNNNWQGAIERRDVLRLWDNYVVWKRRVDKAFQASRSAPGKPIMWVLGLQNLDAALEKLKDWQLAGVAEQIKCPYLLTPWRARRANSA